MYPPASVYPPHSATFGGMMRRSRREAGMVLEDLAKKVGLHASTLSKIERDLMRPSHESVENIGRSLNLMGVAMEEFRRSAGFTGAPTLGALDLQKIRQELTAV